MSKGFIHRLNRSLDQIAIATEEECPEMRSSRGVNNCTVVQICSDKNKWNIKTRGRIVVKITRLDLSLVAEQGRWQGTGALESTRGVKSTCRDRTGTLEILNLKDKEII